MKKVYVIMALLSLLSFRPKSTTWVALGDSITYLNEHLDETGNRVSKGYMTRVADQLPNIQYTNQGHNGWTAIGIAEEIEKLGITKADVYSVFLGTNDWWGGKPLGSFSDYQNATGNGTVYGAFRTIINKFRSLNDQAKIIMITPMQRSDFVYIADKKNNAYGSYKQKNGQSLEQFANAVDSIAAAEKFELVDLYHKSGITQKNLIKYKRVKDPQTGEYRNYRYPKFVDIPFNPDVDVYPYPEDATDMTYDGLHPSDKGNAVIADMLVKIMKKF